MPVPPAIAAGTELRPLMTDPRFPWDHPTESVDLFLSRGIGNGRIHKATKFSRYLLEDDGFDIDTFLVQDMVNECLRMQEQEPGRASHPVVEDGRYQIEWEWRPAIGTPSGFGLIGVLVDANLIDWLIADIKRKRALADWQHDIKMNRLSKDIAEQKQTAVHRKKVAKMFGVDPVAIGKITSIDVDQNGVQVTAEITDEAHEHESSDLVEWMKKQIGDDIAKAESRSFLFGEPAITFNGINLAPGDNVQITSKLTFSGMAKLKQDLWLYGTAFVKDGHRIDPRIVRITDT